MEPKLRNLILKEVLVSNFMPEERNPLLSCISYGLHTKIEDTLRPKRMQWRLHAAVGLNHH